MTRAFGANSLTAGVVLFGTTKQGATVKRVLGLAMALMLTVIGCDGGEETATTSAPAAEEQTVEIADFAFSPEGLTIAAGSTVTWVNQDPSLPHTATSDDEVFDSGSLTEGGEFSFTFDEAGTFAYFCEVHPTMRGTIVVE
jgi:plastocyanin